MAEQVVSHLEDDEDGPYDASAPNRVKKSKAQPIKPTKKLVPPTNLKELFAFESLHQGILKEHGSETRYLNKRIAELQGKSAQVLRKLERKAANLAAAIHEYVEPNRAALTQGKKKKITHEAAVLSWSELMQIVTNLSDRKLVDKLRKIGREDLLRVEYSPSRTKIMEALLTEVKKKKKFTLRGVRAMREPYFSINATGIAEKTRHNLRTGKIEIVVPRRTTPIPSAQED